MTSLRLVSLVSGIYDVTLGVVLLAAAGRLAAAVGVAPPQPPVFADIIGLLLLCVGVGYALPLRDPVRWRAYLWLMGPALKGAGALIFLVDQFTRPSPPAFLLFTVTDGTLAVCTLWALLSTRGAPQPTPAREATPASS